MHTLQTFLTDFYTQIQLAVVLNCYTYEKDKTLQLNLEKKKRTSILLKMENKLMC